MQLASSREQGLLRLFVVSRTKRSTDAVYVRTGLQPADGAADILESAGDGTRQRERRMARKRDCTLDCAWRKADR